MTLDGEYAPSPTDWVREQVEEFEASNGERANTLARTGDPIIVITNRGAKSGKIRKTPLMRIERDGRYLAVGSYGGREANPVWVNNFRANPEMELQDGPVKRRYVARELEGDERADWFAHAVATWATYGDYVVSAAEHGREIPVFLLEPVDD